MSFPTLKNNKHCMRFSIFSLSIVADLLQTHAERDSNNNARELEAPPVMPTDLVKMHHGVFIK
jgi:hypothetical protein